MMGKRFSIVSFWLSVWWQVVRDWRLLEKSIDFSYRLVEKWTRSFVLRALLVDHLLGLFRDRLVLVRLERLLLVWN